MNVFVSVEQAEAVLGALPDGVERSSRLLAALRREGQVRLWWDQTPVDVFLNSTDYRLEVAERIRWEAFMDRAVPFLGCHDLAVFKAFFNRTKDWADLEEMLAAGTIDPAGVSAVLIHYLGAADERVRRLMSFAAP